ncbi:hypothetical protein Slin14017_G121850 [Septoria linicola]|nr:hypothetical protein Slin14017_G121850 [Septoria linicola]
MQPAPLSAEVAQYVTEDRPLQQHHSYQQTPTRAWIAAVAQCWWTPSPFGAVTQYDAADQVFLSLGKSIASLQLWIRNLT